MLDACIQNFVRVSTLYRVGGGRTVRKFRKGCTVLWGNREMTEKYEYCSTVPRTFVHDCGWYIFRGLKKRMATSKIIIRKTKVYKENTSYNGSELSFTRPTWQYPCNLFPKHQTMSLTSNHCTFDILFEWVLTSLRTQTYFRASLFSVPFLFGWREATNGNTRAFTG